MSCVYESLIDGICTMYDGEIEMNGCDENDICFCSSDEDPTILCEWFEEA